MSEKEITVSAAQALYDELWADCERAPHEEAMILARHIAAAEERGRRRGVEEQADLLLECEEALVWCSAADAFSPDGIAVKGWQRIVVPVLERIRAVRKNLAPRDSAPQHKDWCALFGNPEAGKSCDCRGAPRDSGKEKP